MQHADHGPLGAFLRRARETARLSIREIARALDYSQTHLGDVERGHRHVTRPMCDQLSRVLGIDRVELYARAGHLTDEVLRYLCRRPKALGVLELLAAQDADDLVVGDLCERIRSRREAGSRVPGAGKDPDPSFPPIPGIRLPDPGDEGAA